VSALRSIPRDADTVVDARTTARGLYERHGQRVLTFCMSRLRNLEEAQDATQTTFLYVLRALDRGDRPRSEIAWLLAIANNVCLSTQRTLYRRNARIRYAEIDELEAAAEAIGADNEDLIWLRGALERLPQNQRKAIVLREWQGLSYADMAAELGLSIPAVEALLFRARRTLHEQHTGSRRLGALDVASLWLGVRNLRHGAAAKAAAIGAGVTLAGTPFVVAGVAANHQATGSQPAAAAPVVRPAQAHARAASRRRAKVRPARVTRAAAADVGANRAGTGGADAGPAVAPPQEQPPQSQPPGGIDLPPVPVPPLPPLPPVVTDVLGQLPALPPVIEDAAAGQLPPLGG
jgi:RNA polymerase sigma-70 factor (ECF subfamily)